MVGAAKNSSSTNITYTHIHAQRDGSASWPALITHLKQNLIKTLRIEYSWNTDYQFDLVGALLASNSLTSVILKSASFYQPLAAIIGALSMHGKLKSFTIRNYPDIDDKTVESIAILIKENKLETLHFERIHFLTTNFSLICDAIAKSTSLKKLGLSYGTTLSPENEALLQQALGKNKKIKVYGGYEFRNTEKAQAKHVDDTASQPADPKEAPVVPKPEKLPHVEHASFLFLKMTFNKHFEELKKKTTELQNRKNDLRNSANFADLNKAYLAAKNLVTALNRESSLYFANPDLNTFNAFKINCKAEIKSARFRLEEHRGWKQVLGNLALAVLGFGVLYLIAGAINKAVTGKFLFFKTDSAAKVDAVEESINQLNP